jgi:hypothetical protein
MKFQNITFVLIIFFFLRSNSYAQKTPSLIIDSTEIQFTDVSLPFWLKSGQSVGLGVNAKIVSVLEFTVNGTALDFSRVLTLTNNQTVPTNKAWKIEGIGLNKNDSLVGLNSSNVISIGSSSNTPNVPSIFQSPVKFETPGTYTWKVPPGVTAIWVEVWGAGGGGANVPSYNQHSSGGGGGAYGYARFTVVPGSIYSVVVGRGGINTGSGGNSSFGSIISASGGVGGAWTNTSTCSAVAAGGSGGTSSATFNVSGAAGGNGIPCQSLGGNGGKGGSGGVGGSGGSVSFTLGATFGQNGQVPGGGGGGACTDNNAPYANGGSGGRGQVYIYF